jgi:hypothetical protein
MFAATSLDLKPHRRWRYALMARSAASDRGETEIKANANGLEAPKPQGASVLSIDDLRLVVFIIRCARIIAFLQRFVPEKYLPPPEDRVPPALLKRLIHELKKLLPRWKWMSSARALPRSPAKLGDEFFYAITALRLSRIELWRAGYEDCVAVLDDAYSLLFSIGMRATERRRRSKSQRPDLPTQ